MAITTAGQRALRRMVQANLFDGLKEADPTAEQCLDPWDGQNPRDLTSSAIRFRLAQEGASLNEADELIDEMCRRHSFGW